MQDPWHEDPKIGHPPIYRNSHIPQQSIGNCQAVFEAGRSALGIATGSRRGGSVLDFSLTALGHS